MQESDDKIVTLAFFDTEIEATMVAHELKAGGIQAEPAGILTAGFRAEAPGSVKVLVHEHDLEAAKALLDEYIASRDTIDWSQVDQQAMDAEDGEADGGGNAEAKDSPGDA